MEKPLKYEFAKNGNRNTELPNANAQDNSVSFQSGFTLPYELNPANGGKNIERKDMNEILFRICKAINDTAEQVGAWIKLTTENLNDVKEKGYYYQTLNVQSTTERNYPTNKAGYLVVFNNRIDLYGVTQFYKVFNSEKVYIRHTTSATAWSAWDSLVLTSEFNAKFTQLQNTDTKLNNQKEDKKKITLQHSPNVNWNNQKTQGWYYADANGTNKPNNKAMWGIVIDREIGVIYQELHEFNNGKIWSRQNENGVWGAWDSLMLTSEANSTYRKINDSYSKTEVDSKLNSKRNISDSYSKSETNTQINNAVNSTMHRYKALRCNPSANTIQWQTGGLSISKPSGGHIRITHNLNTTNYSISATSAKLAGANLSLQYSIVSMTANYVELASSPDNHPSILCVTIFY